MGLPGTTLIKEICEGLDVKPQLFVRIPCPYCEAPAGMELDPVEGRYWCCYCNKRGTLQDLQVVAEGIFLRRHGDTRRLMETKLGWDKR